jgi:hypothetical protein
MYGNGIFFLQMQDQTRLVYSQWLCILNATVNVRTNLYDYSMHIYIWRIVSVLNKRVNMGLKSNVMVLADSLHHDDMRNISTNFGWSNTSTFWISRFEKLCRACSMKIKVSLPLGIEEKQQVLR